jgi:hypothetical protein
MEGESDASGKKTMKSTYAKADKCQIQIFFELGVQGYLPKNSMSAQFHTS